MQDINGYVSDIAGDKLTVTIGLDDLNEINNYSEGDKVKVTFEYEVESEESITNTFDEKEMVGEVVVTHTESNYMDIKFEEKVPEELSEYDNVEITKLTEEGSQIE